MARLTSFRCDIRPLFTDRDVQGMIKAFNLASYDDVKKNAAAIMTAFVNWWRGNVAATAKSRSLASISD